MSGLDIDVLQEEGLCLVRLNGEARLETVTALDELTEALGEGEHPNVLVDLTGVSFMDSASTGTLIRLHGQLAAAERMLVLFGLQRMIQRLFDRLGLDQFNTASDEMAARERVASRP